MTKLDDLHPDQVIRDARRFTDLLDGPVGAVMVGLVERQHYNEFRAAEGDAARMIAQAKANVLDDVLNAIRTVIATGEHDAIERARIEREQALARARQTPGVVE